MRRAIPTVAHAAEVPPGLRALGAQSVNEVAHAISRRRCQWVWVEGFSGAGKTWFAGKLAHVLGWRDVDLDGLGTGAPSKTYAGQIDSAKLDSVFGVPPRPQQQVVHGVCLRDVVGHMAAAAAPLKVYIAKVTRQPSGGYLWHDALCAEDASETNWLYRDIADYHQRIRPYADADFAFLRYE